MSGLRVRLCHWLFLCVISALFVGCASAPTPPPQQPEPPQCPVVEPVVCPDVPVRYIEVPSECPAPKPVSCPRIVPAGVTGHGDVKIVGAVEYVDVLPLGMRKKARIDTGAETTSIDASDIVEFERDGKRWVKFQVADRVTGETAEVRAQVQRTVLIKQHGSENVRRYVVHLNLRMGSVQDTVEVTLADRERFEYPILIGRNFLEGRVVVDVSRRFLMLDSK